MRLGRAAPKYSDRNFAVRTIYFSAIFLSIICAYLYAATSSPSYERLEKLFLEGKFESAVSESKIMIEKGYGRRDEIYYLKGLGELKINKFQDARDSFGWIVSKYPNSRKAFDAYVGIGDSYMLAGELNVAIGTYNRILDEFRSSKNLPVVYSRLESCYKGLGLREKADYYHKMSAESSPLGFEARGQAVSAQPAVKSVVKQVPDKIQNKNAAVPDISAKIRSRKYEGLPQAGTPGLSASPKEPEEMELIMATERTVSVQVGSFKSRKNAEKLAQKLAAAGYESRIEIPVAQLDKFYRVKVGRVYSRSEAETLKARLKAAGYITKICDGEVCE